MVHKLTSRRMFSHPIRGPVQLEQHYQTVEVERSLRPFCVAIFFLQGRDWEGKRKTLHTFASQTSQFTTPTAYIFFPPVPRPCSRPLGRTNTFSPTHFCTNPGAPRQQQNKRTTTGHLSTRPWPKTAFHNTIATVYPPTPPDQNRTEQNPRT